MILHWEDEADDGSGTLDGMAELIFGNFEKMGKDGIPHLLENRLQFLGHVNQTWAGSPAMSVRL